jgi:cellulose synthase (UDP-forming)
VGHYPDIVCPSVQAALQLDIPENTVAQIHILDDGDRPAMAALARRYGVNYIARKDNIGFKAGNLRNALFQTSGDFILI